MLKIYHFFTKNQKKEARHNIVVTRSREPKNTTTMK